MPNIMTSCLVALGFSLAFGAPLAAGPLEDAGKAYRDGDFATAASLYPPFAEKGDSWAQFALGWMHYYGRGVPQDYAEAVRWYRLAAEQGTARAQNNLGLAYYEGKGVLQDYIRAHLWYDLAARQGMGLATKNRDDIASQMTPDQIAAARQLASECLAQNYQDC